MKLTYDPKNNIAYIRLHEKKGPVRTIKVSDDVNIDLASDGMVYGIELLNANVQLKAQDNGKLIFENESSGKLQEIALTS